jgi:hypothetical protein
MFFKNQKITQIFLFALSAVLLQSCVKPNKRTVEFGKAPISSPKEEPKTSDKQKDVEVPHFPDVVEDDNYTDPVLKEELVDGATWTQRAFDKLTPTGNEIFYRAKEFISGQKSSRFQTYAQPLQCTTNVSHVLNQAGYNFTGAATYAVPSLLDAIENLGGKVHVLPLFDRETGSKDAIIKYINEHFDGKIPTGAVVAGCESIDCQGEGASAHVSILGDKNAKNDLMLYHNNWLRPNNLKGERIEYMVSLENFYDLERPREWMATPWLNLRKDASGKITDIISKSPMIDDLDPFNGKYHIKIAILPEIQKELDKNELLTHHGLVIDTNPHNNVFAFEKDRDVCRSDVPFRNIDARVSPNGAVHKTVYDELNQYVPGQTFMDYNFEFVITKISSDGNWVRIKTYDANMFWGSTTDSSYTFGEIWIKAGAGLYSCFEKGTSY